MNADSLGSTTHLTDATEATTDTREYDAYGMTVSSTGSTATPFGFVGKAGYQQNADSALLLLGHRYYDASTGRFITRDPVRYGRNNFVYCSNSPTNSDDPTGLYHIVIHINSNGLGTGKVFAARGISLVRLLIATSRSGAGVVNCFRPLMQATLSPIRMVIQPKRLARTVSRLALIQSTE